MVRARRALPACLLVLAFGRDLAAQNPSATLDDLRGFSPVDRAAIREACSLRRHLGADAVATCLAEQSASLRASEGPPDLSALPPADQLEIRESCNRLRYSGPATVYACQRAALTADPMRGIRGPVRANQRGTQRPALVGAPRTASGSAAPRPAGAPLVPSDPQLPAIGRGYLVLGLVMVIGLTGLSYLRERRRAWTCVLCGGRVTGPDRRCDACRGPSRAATDPRPPAPPVQEGPDPYVVLGVPRTATRQQIRKAYLRLMMKYHPDKVAQMGPEKRRVATMKSQDLNRAYAALTGRIAYPKSLITNP